jgi:asparagine synthase (glutamine-hydrolysing)
MCGLVAVFHPDPSFSFDAGKIEKMGRTLSHRGPDDHGVSIQPNVAMAHQRLSIVDVASGHQPMWLPNGMLGVVFNGEIYNHDALRKELVSLGAKFYTQTDTEVLLHAYEHWGSSAVERLDGMFSFVLWDAHHKKLLVARDRYGIKPLYVMQGEQGEYLFASEIKALLPYKSRKLRLSPQGIDSYMTLGYIAEPLTIYKEIDVFPAAHTWVFYTDGRACEKQCFWSLSEALHQPEIILNDQEGSELFRRAVASQSIADVPVGSFLSGGLDSSLISATLKQQHREPIVRTYSAGFDLPEYDESRYASAFAKKIGTEHKNVVFDRSLMQQVDRLSDVYDAPFADNAALPTYFLSMSAKKDVKVILSGDGADELFFGYRNHRLLYVESKIKQHLPNAVCEHVLPWLAKAYPNHASIPRFLRARSTFESLSKPLVSGYFNAMTNTSVTLLNTLYSPKFKRSLDGYSTEQHFLDISAGFEHDDPMKVIQFMDMKTYLPGSILTKVDRATMAAGLEARVPFLSNPLVDTMLAMGSSNNVSVKGGKPQLCRWGKELLPKDHQLRRKKSFTSPLDYWFKGLPLGEIYRIILSDTMVESELFDLEQLDKLIVSHKEGTINAGTTLWSLFVLASFLKNMDVSTFE